MVINDSDKVVTSSGSFGFLGSLDGLLTLGEVISLRFIVHWVSRFAVSGLSRQLESGINIGMVVGLSDFFPVSGVDFTLKFKGSVILGIGLGGVKMESTGVGGSDVVRSIPVDGGRISLDKFPFFAFVVGTFF